MRVYVPWLDRDKRDLFEDERNGRFQRYLDVGDEGVTEEDVGGKEQDIRSFSLSFVPDYVSPMSTRTSTVRPSRTPFRNQAIIKQIFFVLLYLGPCPLSLLWNLRKRPASKTVFEKSALHGILFRHSFVPLLARCASRFFASTVYEAKRIIRKSQKVLEQERVSNLS